MSGVSGSRSSLCGIQIAHTWGHCPICFPCLLCDSHNCRSEDVDLEKEFEQNELNSAVYLISMAMQISNFAVNYKVQS